MFMRGVNIRLERPVHTLRVETQLVPPAALDLSSVRRLRCRRGVAHARCVRSVSDEARWSPFTAVLDSDSLPSGCALMLSVTWVFLQALAVEHDADPDLTVVIDAIGTLSCFTKTIKRYKPAYVSLIYLFSPILEG